jgi:hypothetical protein
MTQTYTNPIAHTRMTAGQCPECGDDPDRHLDSPAFWLPRTCDLTHSGVTDRIAAFNADRAAAGPA